MTYVARLHQGLPVSRLSVRSVTPRDLRDALTAGLADFRAMPSHLLFLGVLYPLFGICAGAIILGGNNLSLLFPLVSGFALIGPAVATPIYEVSRRRERGEPVSWRDALGVLGSRTTGSLVVLGTLLLAVFLLWMLSAQAIYTWVYGGEPIASYRSFIGDLFTTGRGWTLIVVGHLVGAAFAAVVFAVSVVSFPLLLDRDVGIGTALRTSMEAVARNPGTMLLWAAIIAGLLVVGSAPLLVGLTVVVPILGHATWHLYRRMIEVA